MRKNKMARLHTMSQLETQASTSDLFDASATSPKHNPLRPPPPPPAALKGALQRGQVSMLDVENSVQPDSLQMENSVNAENSVNNSALSPDYQYQTWSPRQFSEMSPKSSPRAADGARGLRTNTLSASTGSPQTFRMFTQNAGELSVPDNSTGPEPVASTSGSGGLPKFSLGAQAQTSTTQLEPNKKRRISASDAKAKKKAKMLKLAGLLCIGLAALVTLIVCIVLLTAGGDEGAGDGGASNAGDEIVVTDDGGVTDRYTTTLPPTRGPDPTRSPSLQPSRGPTESPTLEPTYGEREYAVLLYVANVKFGGSNEYWYMAILGEKGLSNFVGATGVSKNSDYDATGLFRDVGDPLGIVVLKHNDDTLVLDGVRVDGVRVNFDNPIELLYKDGPAKDAAGCSYVFVNTSAGTYVDESDSHENEDCPYDIYGNGVPSFEPTAAPTSLLRSYEITIRVSDTVNAHSYNTPTWFAIRGEYGMTNFVAQSRFNQLDTTYTFNLQFEDVGNAIELILFRKSRTSLILTRAGVDGTFVFWNYDITMQYPGNGAVSRGTGCSVLVVNLETRSVEDKNDDYNFISGFCPYSSAVDDIPTAEPSLSPTNFPTGESDAPTSITSMPTSRPTYGGIRTYSIGIQVTQNTALPLHFAIIGDNGVMTPFVAREDGSGGCCGWRYADLDFPDVGTGTTLVILKHREDNVKLKGASIDGAGEEFTIPGIDDKGISIAYNDEYGIFGAGCAYLEVNVVNGSVYDASAKYQGIDAYCPYEYYKMGVPSIEPTPEPTVPPTYCGGARFETQMRDFHGGSLASLLVEAEEMARLSDLWKVGDVSIESNYDLTQFEEGFSIEGYKGSGFLYYSGTEQYTYGGEYIARLDFKVNHPGTYRFKWRAQSSQEGEEDEHNDIWLRFGADDYYLTGDKIVCPGSDGVDDSKPCLNGIDALASDYSGWSKCFRNRLCECWDWSTEMEFNHGFYQMEAVFNDVGVYSVEFAGRSKDLWIDRIFLYRMEDNTLPLDEELTALEGYEYLCTDMESPTGAPSEEASDYASYTIKFTLSDDQYASPSDSPNYFMVMGELGFTEFIEFGETSFTSGEYYEKSFQMTNVGEARGLVILKSRILPRKSIILAGVGVDDKYFDFDATITLINNYEDNGCSYAFADLVHRTVVDGSLSHETEDCPYDMFTNGVDTFEFGLD